MSMMLLWVSETGEAVAQCQVEQAKLYQKLAISFVEELITRMEEGNVHFDTPTLIENAIRFFLFQSCGRYGDCGGRHRRQKNRIGTQQGRCSSY